MSHPNLFPGLDVPAFPDAACDGLDPEMWFPDPTDIAAAHVARMVCRRCPAIRACLMWALTHPEPHGVWGGTTPTQRTAMQARLQRITQGATA